MQELRAQGEVARRKGCLLNPSKKMFDVTVNQHRPIFRTVKP